MVVMGIVAATGCRECWASAGFCGGREWRPGAFVTVIHAAHVPGLEAAGWKRMQLYDDDDVPDVLCGHLAAEAA
jgi:hypothetical protein